MKRALVVGYGSIGMRHSRLLKSLDLEVAVVSRRPVDFEPRYSNLTQALSEWQPDYVVVADETSRHHQQIETLALDNFAGPVLKDYGHFSASEGKWTLQGFSGSGVKTLEPVSLTF